MLNKVVPALRRLLTRAKSTTDLQYPQEPTGPVLFADIDGVMHPGMRGTFDRLPLLEAWLLQRPFVEVVISSTWRMENNLEQLRSCFATPELHARIVDVTPELPVDTLYSRQSEIEQWLLANRPNACAIAALDDDQSLFDPRCSWLVLTDPKAGLQHGDLDALDRLLG